MTDRDTQFAGFAKLLWREMLDLKGYIDESDSWIYGDNESPEYELLLAQRAYDLAVHVLEHADTEEFWGGYVQSRPSAVRDIPDLTQWPESPPSQPDAPTEQVL